MARYVKKVKGVRVGRRGRVYGFAGSVRMKPVEVRTMIQRRM